MMVQRTVESIYSLILQKCPIETIVTIVTSGENTPGAQLSGCQALYQSDRLVISILNNKQSEFSQPVNSFSAQQCPAKAQSDEKFSKRLTNCLQCQSFVACCNGKILHQCLMIGKETLQSETHLSIFGSATSLQILLSVFKLDELYKHYVRTTTEDILFKEHALKARSNQI